MRIGWGIVRTTMLCAIVAAVAFGPSAASASTADADSVRVVFSYTADHYLWDATHPPSGVFDDTAGTIVLQCGPHDCVVASADPPFLEEGDALERVAVPGTLSVSRAESGSICTPDTYLPARTVKLAFSAEGVEGSTRNEPRNEFCQSQTSPDVWAGQEYVVTSSQVVEGACYFDDSCPGSGEGASAAGSRGGGGPGAQSGSSELASGDPAAPSVLSALATPADAGTAPQQLVLAALLTVILILLVAFPTSLLNSAVETGADRVSAWWGARRALMPSTVVDSRPAEGSSGEPTPREDVNDGRPPSRPRRSGTWWWAAAGVAAAGIISAFVDPEFGWNAGSVRVLLSIVASFAVDVVLGWTLVIWLVRRVTPGASHSFVFKPLTLLVVIAAVVFARLTGFEPGIVFGLVAGVAFGTLVGRAPQAKAALATLGYAFAVAFIAWLLYGLMGGGAAAGTSFWQTLVLETLAATAIGGMAALPIALFPVRGMAGQTVWAWRRWVWAVCYAVGLFAFFIVLMPMPFSWAGVSWDLIASVGVYLLYAIGAVVAWLLVTRPWRRDEDADDEARASVGDADPEPFDVTR